MISYLTLSAICFIAGVYIGDFFLINHISEVVMISVLIGSLLSLFVKKYRSYILISLLFLIFGAISCAFQQSPAHNEFNNIAGKYVTVEGYVSDLPEENNGRYLYKLKTIRTEYLDKEYSSDQTIILTSSMQLNYGDTIRVKGFLKEFSDKKNSSDFNVKRYYQSRGIFYRMYARELEYADIPGINYPITYYINSFKNTYANSIDKEFSGDESAVLKAITLGNKRQFSDDFNNLLTKTGIKKFFYPAFLHIYLISLIVAFLLKRFKKSTRDYIFVAVLIIYASVNCQSPVIVKNALAVVIGIIILKKYGFTHKPDIVSLTVLVVAISNPLYCFDVGFIISLTTGLMIYYFNDILSSVLWFVNNTKIRRFLVFYLITTFGLLPIIAYFFNGLNLYTNLLSPLYSIVVIVLIILTPIMCILSSLFGSSLFIKNIISGILWFFTSLPGIIDKLPFSHIWVNPPDIIFIAAFFFTLYVLYQIYMKDIKKTINICAICASLGLWCSVIVNHITEIGTMNVVFVNVGQGDGAVIDIKGGETIIIDGGGKAEFSDYDAGEHIFAPYLADNGYFDIDKAFVSHYHSDHCLGIISAMKLYDVKEVVMPDYDRNNEYRIEIEQTARANNVKIRYVSKGDVISFPSGMVVNILSPSKDDLSEDENENSLVMEVEYNGFRCLFTGDIGTETEEKLLKDVKDCDVIKMAHHGSSNSNSEKFAKAVAAEYVIVSAGENNMYGFPKPEATYNYQQTGAKVAGTHVNGDITVTVDKNGNYEIYKNIRE